MKEVKEYMQGSFWDSEIIVSERIYKVQLSYMGDFPIYCILDIISSMWVLKMNMMKAVLGCGIMV